MRWDRAGFPSTCRSLARLSPNRNDANGYYRELGLPPWATTGQIKSAYRSVMRDLHPDVAGDDYDEELFRKAQHIYETLSDSEKKQKYDSVPNDKTYISDWERQFMDREAFNVGELSDLATPDDLPVFSQNWTFFGEESDEELAQRWYEELLQVHWDARKLDRLMIELADLDSACVVRSQTLGMKRFVFDRTTPPNWATALLAMNLAAGSS